MATGYNLNCMFFISIFLLLFKPIALAQTFSADQPSISEHEETKSIPVYVKLSPENDYTDRLSKKLRFTRAATSGAGTGVFIGEGFEFAKGACTSLDQNWLEKNGWKPHSPGCSRRLLESDWCARLRIQHTTKYTVHFLSWTSGPSGFSQNCMGDCQNNDSHTSYIRTRAR